MKRFNAKLVKVRKGYLTYKRIPCHRIIWEQDVGPIPEGFDIHHKDGNKFNNLIENLECLSKSDHMKLHALARRKELSENMKKNSKTIHAWLETEKGRKFLRENGKKMHEMLETKTFTCELCKKEFQSKHNRHVRFCGDGCVSQTRRLSKVDDEERICIICTSPFVINRYQKTKTCSFLCRNKHIGNLKRKS